MKVKRIRDILFLCQYFYPENNSSATLPFDTACALADAGYSVSALCGMPKEYTKKRDVPIRETVRGVQIHRLRYLQAGRKRNLGRMLNFFSFTLRALLCLREIGSHGLVIVYSNPPVLPIVTAIANKCFGTRFVFVAYDLYPEIALRMGSIRKNGGVDRVMTWINQRVFRRASAVVALSDDMRDTLLRLRPELDGHRVHVLPNWAHESAPSRTNSEDGVFTVGYFGNLGVVQDVETLLSAIERLHNDKRFRFRIIGHGSSFSIVHERTKEFPNVHVEHFLTGEELESALGTCDCCVVTLRDGMRGLCMPSKYYSYLQAGAAIVSVMEPDSALSREVVAEQIGAAVSPGDVEGLCAVLTAMANDLPAVREAGARAAVLYRNRYLREQTLDRYTALVRSVLEDT